ncbi:MAG: hypothetical protein GXO83_03400 [Chlorobi bacterium]|nr:hypothetical protein [Chlorobiota bacterium]
MKNKVLSIISVTAVAALLLAGCTKSDIDKAREAYDFNNVIPKIVELNVPSSFEIGRTYTVDVPARGGSVFTWTLISGDGSFVELPGFEGNENSFKKGLQLNSSSDTIIILSVQETTAGGKTDEVVDTLTNSSGDFTPFTARPILGSSLAPVGFSRDYQVALFNENDKAFSSYAWGIEGSGASVSPDSDNPWMAKVSFTESGVVTLWMVETNSQGMVADTSTYDITIINYCAVANFNDFAGTYTGYDHNAYGINDDNVTFTVKVKDKKKRTVTISDGFWYALYGPNYWGETVTGGNAAVVTINVDGSITFENQFATQTEDAYDYYIGPRSSPAYWTGCDGKIVLVIPYQGYWDDGYSGGFSAQLYGEKSLSKGALLERSFVPDDTPAMTKDLPPLPQK